VMNRRGEALALVEAHQLLGAPEVLPLDQAQRDDPAQRDLGGLIDGSGRAGGDQAIDPEGADPRARLDDPMTYAANSSRPLPRMKKW